MEEKTKSLDQNKITINKFVYSGMFMVGIISILPWDSTLTVSSYWKYKFKNDSYNGQDLLSPLQKQFESYINLATGIGSTPTVVAHLIFGHLYSVQMKSFPSLVGIVLIYISILILAFLDTTRWQNVFMALSVVQIGILNAFRALFRAANSANAGKFPVEYMGAINNGLSVAGLIPVVLNICILSFELNIEKVGGICFGVFSLIIVIGAICYTKMVKDPMFQYYTNLPQNMSMISKVALNPLGVENVNRRPQIFGKSFWASIVQIHKKCWLYLASTFVLLVTTNCVYPGVTFLIQPVNPDLMNKHIYVQLVNFLNFNVFNTLGCFVSGYLQWPGDASKKSQLILMGFSILRIALLPILIFSNIAPGNRITMTWFESDWSFIIGMAILAFTDGYFFSNIMMFGPKAGENDNMQELTTNVLIISQPISIFFSGIISTLIVQYL